MEPDRYQYNSKLFIIGMISLLTGLSSLIFSLFILPFLLLGLKYNVPTFISVWREWIKDNYDMSDLHASWFIFLIFFVSACVLVFTAHWASNRVDNQIYGIKKVQEATVANQENLAKSFSFGFKLMLLIILVLSLLWFIQWLLAPV